MHADAIHSAPALLSAPDLARRLADLCGDERNVQVDFLLHLGEFDRRRAWAEAGWGSLWDYALEVLHLREGAAWRRIEAMKLLRRFPTVEGALRDGRLCLTTLSLLGPVLTDENVTDLVARAAFLSKADTERLVASMRPRVAPKDGIRKVSCVAASATAHASGPELSSPRCAGALTAAPDGARPALALAPVPAPAPAARAELRPVSGDTYSLRVTLDAACKAELDQLVSLLSHAHGGDLAAVLREAIRCGIARHGKRRGAVAPARRRQKAAPEAPSTNPRWIPMDVRREVMRRDGGRCAWTSPDGKRCGSTWRLEFGHVTPVALGGASTVANVRVECAVHNQHEADRVFGREHMERLRRGRHFRQRK
jgi:5-methylcytosine-specific restriction endonuclease McrA